MIGTWLQIVEKELVPKCILNEPLISAADVKGMLVGSEDEGKGELWVDPWLLLTTGNNGWDTETEGVVEGNPGGVICGGWSIGVEDTGSGGLAVCTGNSGCWA